MDNYGGVGRCRARVTRMSPMLRLRPTARPVRRAADEVQFGLSPEHGIVLAGLTDSEADLLLSLAATSGTARDSTLSRRFDVPLPRVGELVEALRGHGLLVEAPPSPAPQEVSFAVVGRGTVVDRVREELDAGTVARVRPAGDEPTAAADLAILCARDAIPPDLGQAWHLAGVAHLPVVLRDGEVIIGPLVLPGASVCLRCLDLHRRDRDPAWPRILTQLTSTTSELTPAVDAPPAQTAVIAGLVLMLAQESLASRVEPGVSWQIALPTPAVRTRLWTPHPHCNCSQQSAGGEAAPRHESS